MESLYSNALGTIKNVYDHGITGVLKIFDTVYILTPTGGTSNCTIVPALLMYNEAYRYGHYGTGSAIATVIFVLSAAVSIFSLKLMNQKESIEY